MILVILWLVFLVGVDVSGCGFVDVVGSSVSVDVVGVGIGGDCADVVGRGIVVGIAVVGVDVVVVRDRVVVDAVG